jgi:hypothetical protein
MAVANAMSGNTGAATVDISSIAAQVWNTRTAVYGSTTTFGGDILLSGDVAAATVDISSIAAQVWNTLVTTATSSATFGGAVLLSGDVTTASVDTSAIAGQVWNSLLSVHTSSTTFGGNFSGLAHAVDCSGNHAILVAVSGLKVDVSGRTIDEVITDAASLTSGTVGHTLRLLRWAAWENQTIDKTYTPNRLYMKSDETNVSAYFTLTDTSNSTKKERGG